MSTYNFGVPCLFGLGPEAPASCDPSTYTYVWFYKMLPCHMKECTATWKYIIVIVLCFVFCAIVVVFGLNVQTPSIIIHPVVINVEMTLGSVQDSLRLADSITDD